MNRLITAMIGDCQIDALPTSIGKFKVVALVQCNSIHNSRMKLLFKALRKLELEYNEIKALPSQIGAVLKSEH